MKPCALLVACLALPALARAAPHLALLGDATLAAAPARHHLLAQADLPPPPPPPEAGQPYPPPPSDAGPPSAPVATAEVEAPGLGAVLGFMITGGVVTATGAGLTVVGLLELLFGAAVSGTYAGSSAGATFSVVGIVYLVFGIAHLGVGAWLLIHGNGLRVQRNAYNEAHGITEGPPRPAAFSQPMLAWSF